MFGRNGKMGSKLNICISVLSLPNPNSKEIMATGSSGVAHVANACVNLFHFLKSSDFYSHDGKGMANTYVNLFLFLQCPNSMIIIESGPT